MPISIYDKYELTIEDEYSVDESEYPGENQFVTYKNKKTKLLYGHELMKWLSDRLTDDELIIIDIKQNYIYLGYFNPNTGEYGERRITVKEL